MIYTFLITIVFIAELIIAITILQNLHKLDKKVIELDETVGKMNPSIKDISRLVRKISEQWLIIAQDFVDKTKQNAEDVFLKYVSKTLLAILLFKLNFKFVKRIRAAKLTKTLVKGWSLIESMV